jgi:hypothetical protein
MTGCHDKAVDGRHRSRSMSPQVAALPIAEQTVELRADGGALLDRAAAVFRSWAAGDLDNTIGHVLAAWRMSERDLDATTPGSDAWNEASERFLAARSEYRRLFELAAVNAEALRRSW